MTTASSAGAGRRLRSWQRRSWERGALAVVLGASGLSGLAGLALASAPAASATPLVGAGLGLELASSISPGTVTAGGGTLVTQVLTVENVPLLGLNLGLLDATGVSLTETLPTGEDLVSAVPVAGTSFGQNADNFTCTTSSNSFVCTPPAINGETVASGNTDTIDVTISVPASTPAGTLANVATVRGNLISVANILSLGGLINLNLGGLGLNLAAADSAESDLTVVAGAPGPNPDLTLSVSPLTQAVPAGTSFTQTVSVGNVGTLAAASPDLSFTVAAGETYNGITGLVNPDNFSCTAGPVTGPGTVSCTAASLAAHSSDSGTLNFSVAAATPNGTYTNTATLTTTTAGSNSPVSETVDYVVTGSHTGFNPDLSISASPPSQSVGAGGSFSQVVSVSNTGTLAGSNPAVSLPLVGGETFVSATPITNPDGFSCAATGGVLTCSAASLGAGHTDSATLNFTAGPTAATYTNTYTLAINPVGTSNSPVSASASFTVTAAGPNPDLHITAGVASQTVTAGNAFDQSVSVSNTGTLNAANPTVTLNLADETFTSATMVSNPDGFTCNASGGVLTCSAANLPAGSSDSGTIHFTAGATPETVANTYTLTSTTAGSNAPSATASFTVVAAGGAPFLTVAITPRHQSVTAGSGPGNLTQTVTVGNTGGTAAANPQLTYTIAPGEMLTGVGAISNPDGFHCTATATLVTCTATSLAAGNSDSAQLSFTVPATTPAGTFSNTATLTTTTAGSNSPVSATATVRVLTTPPPTVACRPGSKRISGYVSSTVFFNRGSLCLIHAHLAGALLFGSAGGHLQILDSRIDNIATIDHAGSVTICDSGIALNTTITKTRGPVIIGQGSCEGNTFSNSLDIENGTGEVQLDGNLVVNFLQIVSNDARPTGVNVQSNHVDANLTCTANIPGQHGNGNQVNGTNDCPGVTSFR